MTMLEILVSCGRPMDAGGESKTPAWPKTRDVRVEVEALQLSGNGSGRASSCRAIRRK